MERALPAHAPGLVARSEAVARARGRPGLGQDAILRQDTSEHWLTVVTGVPDRLTDGRMVFIEESEDTRRLTLDGEPVTPPGLQVAAILDVGEDVLFSAHEDPTELHVWRIGDDRIPMRITSEEGVHGAVRSGDVMVLVSELLDPAMQRARVLRDGDAVAEIRSLAETLSSRRIRPSPSSRLARSGPCCSRRAAPSPMRHSRSCSIRTVVLTSPGS